MNARVYAAAITSLIGCHSAGVVVEHRGAGGIDVDHKFVPRLGRDGHYISFPAHAFVNCVDAVAFDNDAAVHEKHASTRKDACSESSKVASFVGYRSKGEDRVDASWISEETDGMYSTAVDALKAALGVEELKGDPVARFSFLHFSDVQIREPAAKLTNASATLDKIIGTFQRDYDQELYSHYTYAALIDTVNEELKLAETKTRPAPSFMIHTGDSVDAGLKSEFSEFLSNSNRLDIPWYQAVGNHDVLAFGNLKLYSKNELSRQAKPRGGTTWTKDNTVLTDADCSTKTEECSCTQVADLLRDVEYAKDYDNLGEPIEVPSLHELASLAPALLRRICIRHRVRNDRFIMDPTEEKTGKPMMASNAFLAAHCLRSGESCIADSTNEAAPYVRVTKSKPCATFGGEGQSSLWHGFDLGPNFGGAATVELTENIKKKNEYVPAYYCFEAAKAGHRRVWGIVLDTNAPNGAYGDVSEEQLKWLDGLLNAKDAQFAKTDLIMLFGHHPLGHMFSTQRRNRLLDLLTKDERLVAYFTGHTHTPELRVIHGHPNHHHFWEVVAPSVIDFPQQVRQVTMKTLGDEIGYFEVLTFAPQGSGPSEPKIQLASEGAKRDTCSGNPNCENGVPRLVSRATTYPRLFFRMPKD